VKRFYEYKVSFTKKYRLLWTNSINYKIERLNGRIKEFLNKNKGMKNDIVLL
jgi:hypothetical protein